MLKIYKDLNYNISKIESICCVYNLYKQQGRVSDYPVGRVVSNMFNISERTLSRYLRLQYLCTGFRILLVSSIIPLRTGVELSYLSLHTQEILLSVVSKYNWKITLDIAKYLRSLLANSDISYFDLLRVLNISCEEVCNGEDKVL